MRNLGLADRLARHVALTPAEADALALLERDRRSVRRGAVLVGEQADAREFYIVRDGWLHGAVHLGDGSRQIVHFHFPGDVAGVSALVFGRATETLTAVTDVVLCPVDRPYVARLFHDQPRLAALLFMLAAADRTALADRLSGIGRTSARARVASLLCDIAARLRLAGAEDEGGGFVVPLTQEEIGDATGLTAVHVNRMMRALVQDGLIGRAGNRVRLLDEERLAREAGYTDRSRIDAGWIPAVAG